MHWSLRADIGEGKTLIKVTEQKIHECDAGSKSPKALLYDFLSSAKFEKNVGKEYFHN